MHALLEAQLKKLISHPSVPPNEAAEWMRLLPRLTDAEANELSALLLERRKIMGTLAQELTRTLREIPPATRSSLTLEAVKAWDGEEYLKDAQIVALEGFAQKLVFESRRGEVRDFLLLLNKKISALRTRLSAEQSAQYASLISRLRFYILELLTDGEREDLFLHHLLRAYRLRVDADHCVYRFLDAEDDDVLAGAHRQKILAWIPMNDEQIGQLTKSDGGASIPTVANWIKEYLIFAGKSRKRGSLEEARFFIEHPAARRLAPQDRDLLVKILHLYDMMEFPPRAFVRISVREFLPSNIRGEDVEHTAPSPVSPEEIRVAYLGRFDDEEKIRAATEEMKKARAGGASESALFGATVFPKGTTRPNPWKIAGLFRAFAEEGVLDNLLKSREAADAVRGFLKEQGRTKELRDLDISPTGPLMLRVTLEFCLSSRGGLPESEAARNGMHVANAIAKRGDRRYVGIAYFNLGDRAFYWKR